MNFPTYAENYDYAVWFRILLGVACACAAVTMLGWCGMLPRSRKFRLTHWVAGVLTPVLMVLSVQGIMRSNESLVLSADSDAQANQHLEWKSTVMDKDLITRYGKIEEALSAEGIVLVAMGDNVAPQATGISHQSLGSSRTLVKVLGPENVLTTCSLLLEKPTWQGQRASLECDGGELGPATGRGHIPRIRSANRSDVAQAMNRAGWVLDDVRVDGRFGPDSPTITALGPEGNRHTCTLFRTVPVWGAFVVGCIRSDGRVWIPTA